MSALDRLIPRPLSRPLSQPLSLRPVLLGAFLVIALVGLLQVIQTSGVTSTGYSLRSLEQERLARQAQVHQLEAEVAALTSMERIESEARGRLGMVRIRPARPLDDLLCRLRPHNGPFRGFSGE